MIPASILHVPAPQVKVKVKKMEQNRFQFPVILNQPDRSGMNASYNQLVTKHLPNAQIVYDCFHMQSQYGRDVLGVVRLNEAGKHKAAAKEILADIGDDTDKETKQAINQMAQTETQEYSKRKKLRWPLLTNSGKLSEMQSESLQAVLQDHLCFFILKTKIIRTAAIRRTAAKAKPP